MVGIHVFKMLPGNGSNVHDLVLVLPTRINSSFADVGRRECSSLTARQIKQSALETRINKPVLNNELLLNYRPISNLRFISKAIDVLKSHDNSYHFYDDDCQM